MLLVAQSKNFAFSFLKKATKETNIRAFHAAMMAGSVIWEKFGDTKSDKGVHLVYINLCG